MLVARAARAGIGDGGTAPSRPGPGLAVRTGACHGAVRELPTPASVPVAQLRVGPIPVWPPGHVLVTAPCRNCPRRHRWHLCDSVPVAQLRVGPVWPCSSRRRAGTARAGIGDGGTAPSRSGSGLAARTCARHGAVRELSAATPRRHRCRWHSSESARSRSGCPDRSRARHGAVRELPAPELVMVAQLPASMTT